MPRLTVAEITQICEGLLQGDPAQIIGGANSLEAAGPQEISFVSNKKSEAAAKSSRAGCLIVDHAFAVDGAWSLVRVREPRRAFGLVLGKLFPPEASVPGIHPAAVIAASAQISAGCSIGAYAVIGEGASLAPSVVVGPHAYVGDRTQLGEGSRLFPHVIVYADVKIGARVILHAGAIVGADGFGFVMSGDHWEKFPQVGRVRIEDDVEIGANCCIDRAALGVTRIGRGTKLDNMVHIAHNCDIGCHVVIAAQTGLAGGVVVEDYAVLGGQVGIGEKARVAKRAVIGSGAGILSFARVAAGEPVWGMPARPLREHLKGLANVRALPDLRNSLRDLQQRINALEGASQSKE